MYYFFIGPCASPEVQHYINSKTSYYNRITYPGGKALSPDKAEDRAIAEGGWEWKLRNRFPDHYIPVFVDCFPRPPTPEKGIILRSPTVEDIKRYI